MVDNSGSMKSKRVQVRSETIFLSVVWNCLTGQVSPGNEGLHGKAASPTHVEQLLKTSSRPQRRFILNVQTSLTDSKILHSRAYSARLPKEQWS